MSQGTNSGTGWRRASIFSISAFEAALVDVDEGDLGALFGEVLDDRGADARAATGDEDGAPREAGIGSERGHAIPLDGKICDCSG